MSGRTRRWTCTGLVAAAALLAGTQTVWAQASCVEPINRLGAEWDAIGMTTSAKPAGRVIGQGSHSHVQAEVEVMRNHYRQAVGLCRDGKEHEALLHVDLVRAWLKLPGDPHPASHQPLAR